MEDKLKILEQETNELYKKVKMSANSEELVDKLLSLIEEVNKVVSEIKIDEKTIYNT